MARGFPYKQGQCEDSMSATTFLSLASCGFPSFSPGTCWPFLMLGWLITAGGLRAPTFNQAAAHVSIQYRLNVYIWVAQISVHSAQCTGSVQPR